MKEAEKLAEERHGRARDAPRVWTASIIELDANSIVDAMKFIHGGTWSVDIDHESCFVLIARICRIPCPPKGTAPSPTLAATQPATVRLGGHFVGR